MVGLSGYVHDIEAVLTGLSRHGLTVPADAREAVVLTDYATASRYPSREEPVTPEEYAAAVVLAERVVIWAAGILANCE